MRRRGRGEAVSLAGTPWVFSKPTLRLHRHASVVRCGQGGGFRNERTMHLRNVASTCTYVASQQVMQKLKHKYVKVESLQSKSGD